MVNGHGREGLKWGAACTLWVVWGLGAAFGGSALRAQSATDGAIGGQVVSAAGGPVEGALVVARELNTGLTLRALSGAKGEFLVVRLPAGEYEVTVEDAGVELTLAGPVEVGAGEVAEVKARMQPAAIPAGMPEVKSDGTEMTQAEMAALPVDGGRWS